MTSPGARAVVLACLCAALAPALSCTSSTPKQPAFSTPEDAVRKLGAAVKDKNPDAVLAIFGPDGKDLVDVSDANAARRRRQVFKVAMAEGWRLTDDGADRRTLVIGNEAWPFPVPLVKGADGWKFDTAAGKEEVLARRIGRNELAAILICRTYVRAQHLYARSGHDGKPAGVYAMTLASDAGRQNGLYWAVGAWAAAQSAGGPGGAGGGRQPRADRGRPAAVALPRLLLPDPDRAGMRRRRAAPATTWPAATCRAASRSSRGPRSTTPPAS